MSSGQVLRSGTLFLNTHLDDRVVHIYAYILVSKISYISLHMNEDSAKDQTLDQPPSHSSKNIWWVSV